MPIPPVPPFSKIATRLKSLTDDPIHELKNNLGFRITNATFDPINNNEGVAGSAFPYSRGLLPAFNPDGSQPFPPEWVHGGSGFYTAVNPVYAAAHGSAGSQPRLYWNAGVANTNLVQTEEYRNGDTRFFIVPDTFNPGGYHYEEALAGRHWVIPINPTQSITSDPAYLGNEDYVSIFPPADGFDTWAENPVGMSDAGTQFTYTTWNTNVLAYVGAGNFPSVNFPFVNDIDFRGSNSWSTNAGAFEPANKSLQGLEVLTQFNYYPPSSFLGTEVGSNPQEFSILIYDQKRNSHFKMPISTLASTLSQIVDGLGGITTGGLPSINLTMPLLTTAQLDSYYNQTAGQASDLNADGSVSTADLLVFLTQFGSEDVGQVEVGFERFYDSTITLHSGSLTDTDPFYSIDLNITEAEFDLVVDDLIALSGGGSAEYDFSFGVIDLSFAPYLTNPTMDIDGISTADPVEGTLLYENSAYGILIDEIDADSSYPNYWNYYAPARVMLNLYAWAVVDGGPWNPSDFGWVNVAFETPYTEGLFPEISSFVCDWKWFIKAIDAWGGTHPTQSIYTERFPRDEGLALNVMTSLNYKHAEATIAYDFNIQPSHVLFGESSSYWSNPVATVGDKPDAIVFANSAPYDYNGIGYVPSNERMVITIKGFMETPESGIAGKAILYCIFFPSHSANLSPLVGFFGVVTKTQPDPVVVDGFERHPFEFTLDPLNWVYYTGNYTGTSTPPVTDFTLGDYAGFPDSAWGPEYPDGDIDVAISIGAIPFFNTVNRVVITGTSYTVVNTRGAVT